jgi:hypothetical protein
MENGIMWLRGKIVDNETKEGKMLIAEELAKGRNERIIKEHKERMYDMRFFSLEWQAIHQKRWYGKDCNNNTCDCEELYEMDSYPTVS